MDGTEAFTGAALPKLCSNSSVKFAMKLASQCPSGSAANLCQDGINVTSRTDLAIGMADAAAWLAPQPVSVLFGLGRAAVARLEATGIYTCGDLVTADSHQLTAALGKNASTIRDLAAGIDPRAVTPEREAKSISAETTFVSDLSKLTELEAELEVLCQKVSTRLKAQAHAGGRDILKLKRPDHTILTRSQTLPEPTDKAHMLFEIGSLLLAKETGGRKSYRLMGIGADQLGPPAGSSLLI